MCRVRRQSEATTALWLAVGQWDWHPLITWQAKAVCACHRTPNGSNELTVERTLQQERLISIIRRFPQRQILVVGDSVADQFIYGAISRVSREAPVFILRHEHTETTPGGAANCAMNLASLGASVALISVVGEDEAGRALIEKLNAAGVDCAGVLSEPGIITTTKVRILAGQVHSTRQQVIRIDYEGDRVSDGETRKLLNARALEQAQNTDA